MSDDHLTRERIQRLQLMGIQIWQERGRRPVPTESTVTAAQARPADSRHPQAPERTAPARRAAAEPQTVSVDAPRPDASQLDWQQLRAAVSSCTACGLCQTRTQTVFGVGNDNAELMVIGEAPGAEEDRRGEPFVGRAGQLLDAMLLAVGMKRSEVFIANVLKCRPPGNRDPHVDEASQCSSYLQRQIELVNPKVLVTVGRVASQLLLNSTASLGRLRGKLHHYEAVGIPVVVTYHPAYLLRSPEQKRKAWEDLLMSQKLLREATS